MKSLGYLFPPELSNFLTSSYGFYLYVPCQGDCFPHPTQVLKLYSNPLRHEACNDPLKTLEHADRTCQYTGQGQKGQVAFSGISKGPIGQTRVAKDV